jgi:hypothetical protein
MNSNNKKTKKSNGLLKNLSDNKLVVFVALFSFVAGMFVIQTFARGKPNVNNGTVAVQMVLDTNSNGAPNYGEYITFSVETSVTEKPFVALDCYQNGVRVYGMSMGIFESYPFTKTATLRSDKWTGGGADCVATGYYSGKNGRQTTFAALDFYVAP